MPVTLQSLMIKDIRASHFETKKQVWFRCKRNWTDVYFEILDYYFPEDSETYEGVPYLCGAAHIDGTWIIGFLNPSCEFIPL